jgi:DNA polymerase-1
MATTYIENYFARYKGVKEFIDRAIEDAKKTKKTSTLLGRIRFLPDINSPNKNVREFAERTAVNTPIQGTAADLIKMKSFLKRPLMKSIWFKNSSKISWKGSGTSRCP